MRLVLASASPARRETLRRAGIDPDIVVSGVHETQAISTEPAGLAAELAKMKCRTVDQQLDDPRAVVVGCDSLLDVDGQALGKPVDAAAAATLWRQMRGRTGVLHTGHCVRFGGDERVETASTIVHFAFPSDEEIDQYIATGEPLNVAGGFTIDGYGGAFISGIEGDHHNVVGISLPLLRTMLTGLGIGWPRLWAIRRADPGPEQ